MKTELSESLLSEITNFRRNVLHRYPEASGDEKETAKRVSEFLGPLQPDQIITGLGGHGILAVFGSGEKEVLIRSELDALPIQEINTFEYASVREGVSHKCGHDGHSAILCGLARVLSENRPDKGKVLLLFQPSEENGMGAKAVMDDEKFKLFKPDFVFSLHNVPGYPMGEIFVKTGTFTASVDSIIIKLFGKTSHAAEPENGINPAAAIAEILQETQKLDNNFPKKDDMVVVAPVYLTMGEEAYGISAGYGEVHLTIRTWNDSLLDQVRKKAESIVEEICGKHRLKHSVEWTQTFSANQNDPLATDIIRSAAKESGIQLREAEAPFKWGEDFGLFTRKYRGAMFGLGSGEDTPALHNPDYDFPDEIIKPGMLAFLGIINKSFNE